jgi:SNF2-related domain/Helicase conserved C-terminal domain
MKMSLEELCALRFAEVELRRDQMHEYQGIGYEFMKLNPFSALFIDMGLGKTITSLTLIVDMIMSFEVEKVLVIGPLKVATDTWPNEIRKWAHTAVLNHSLIRCDDDDPRVKAAGKAARTKARLSGSSQQEANSIAGKAETAMSEKIRAEKAMSPAGLHIINREQVEWLVNLHGKNWPYRMVIIDESSGFKDIQSHRFKALAKVRRVPGLITRMHLLTATPAAETYEHLFAQIYLLDLGQRLGKGITKYRRDYFNYNQYSRKHKLRDGCEEIILDKIKDICLVMKAEDYLQIEKPTIAPCMVHLADSQMSLYRQMEKEFFVTLPDGTDIEAETAAALSSKLLQMASGVLYETKFLEDWDTDDMKKVTKVHHLHDHKIEMLRQIVEESNGEPLLVGYHFKSSLNRLLKAFPKAVAMDREGKCLKAWNARKIPMLLIHPQSGGHGLNMQKGGHNLIFFDLPWSLELYLQLIGRLARQGQKNHVVVRPLIASGTLDEFVFKSLCKKEDAQEMLFTLLKLLIKKAKKQRKVVKTLEEETL